MIYEKHFTWGYALQGSDFQEEATDEDMKLGFKFGFQHVLEHQKSLGKNPASPFIHSEVNKIKKDIIIMNLRNLSMNGYIGK